MVKIKLPYPPSVNHYLQRNRRGGVRLSDKARDYQWQVFCACQGQPQFDKPVMITVDVWFPDKRQRDLGNLDKCLIDALVKAKMIVDDDWRWLPDIRWRARGVVKHGKVLVRIEEWQDDFKDED